MTIMTWWILIDFRGIHRILFIIFANYMLLFSNRTTDTTFVYIMVLSHYLFFGRLYHVIMLFRIYCLLYYYHNIIALIIRRLSFIFPIFSIMYYIIIAFILFIVSNVLVCILIYFIDD